MPSRPLLGARWSAGLPPGVYERIPEPVRPLDVRMDVAAFVGLCERGPVATAVAVGSWSEFVAVFGRPGGGRLLPDCVNLFFANGGRRAVISRAMDYLGATTARWALPGVSAGGAAAELDAHDPGAWANEMAVAWTWKRAPLKGRLTRVDDTHFDAPAGLAPSIGTMLRQVTTVASPPGIVERTAFVIDRRPLGGGMDRLTLHAPLPAAALPDVDGPVEEVLGTLAAAWAGVREQFDGIGLHPAHPRALAKVLAEGASALLRPTAATGAAPLTPNGALTGAGTWSQPRPAERVRTGGDAAATTDREVFFTPPGAGMSPGDDDVYAARPSPLDALDEYDEANAPEPVSLVCLPDLLHPIEATAADVVDEPPSGGLRFGACLPGEAETTSAVELDWPLLAATAPTPSVDDKQADLVAWCEARQGAIAVLDLPPGRAAGDVLLWRQAHASPRAAAYAPYLRVVPAEDRLGALRTVPPCGAVCGLVARQERVAGVHAAPANLTLAGVPALAADPLLPDAGFLHEARVNLFRATEAGLRLLGSRTTSIDADWTHVNVRRVVDWVCRQVALDARWAPFEPNDPHLWRRLVLSVSRRLAALGTAGAWAGSTPAESWFVRCDETTTPLADRDEGRVVVLVGVAPSVPAEFLVFRLSLVRDGDVRVEAVDG